MNRMNYSADEILQIAERIEYNASQYYRQAALFTQEQKVHDLFAYLSQMEQQHASIFSTMRTSLSPEERKVQPYDPGNEMLYYLEGMAGLHAWEGKAGPAVLLHGTESLEQVLRIAINAEKETVYFYTFLQDFVPPYKGKEQVGKIIHEEMQHVATLNKELAKIPSP